MPRLPRTTTRTSVCQDASRRVSQNSGPAPAGASGRLRCHGDPRNPAPYGKEPTVSCTPCPCIRLGFAPPRDGPPYCDTLRGTTRPRGLVLPGICPRTRCDLPSSLCFRVGRTGGTDIKTVRRSRSAVPFRPRSVRPPGGSPRPGRVRCGRGRSRRGSVRRTRPGTPGSVRWPRCRASRTVRQTPITPECFERLSSRVRSMASAA